MRLWPLAILKKLPDRQLLGQHRECCALRGKGWGRKHSTVDYVFKHPYYWLWIYHISIMEEMRRRGFGLDVDWCDLCYRGKKIGYDHSRFTTYSTPAIAQIYPEHDKAYVAECIKNLRRKGVEIKIKNKGKEK